MPAYGICSLIGFYMIELLGTYVLEELVHLFQSRRQTKSFKGLERLKVLNYPLIKLLHTSTLSSWKMPFLPIKS